MSGTIVFVVDLDAAGAPPAQDSVRQLLALIEGLPSEGGQLDWRLTSVSLNSPLRAEVAAFTPAGEQASDAHVAAAAEAAFALLDATNDNEPEKRVRALAGEERKRLRALLQPMKERSGSIRVLVPGRSERTIRAERAKRVLTAIAEAPRKRSPEMGSIEGQILSATTYYGNPAVRVRKFLTDEEVLCVFSRETAQRIGAAHTLEEVWGGKRVVVSGKISFDGAGRAQVVYAENMRLLKGGPALGALLDAVHQRGESPVADDWGAEVG